MYSQSKLCGHGASFSRVFNLFRGLMIGAAPLVRKALLGHAGPSGGGGGGGLKSRVAAAQSDNAARYEGVMDFAGPVDPAKRVVFETQNGTGSGPVSFDYMTHADKAKIRAVKNNWDGRKGLNVYDDSMRAIDMKMEAAQSQMLQTMMLENMQGKALGPHPLNLPKFQAFMLDEIHKQSVLAQTELQHFAFTPEQAALAFKFKTKPESFSDLGAHLQAASMKWNFRDPITDAIVGDRVNTSWGLDNFGHWFKKAYHKDMESLRAGDIFVRTRPWESLGVHDSGVRLDEGPSGGGERRRRRRGGGPSGYASD
jgi:hypothetical protein